MQKYIDLAKEMGLANALPVTTEQIVFDPRVLLKCRWGCEDYFNQSIKCSTRGYSPQELQAMVQSYDNVLLLHGHDARALSQAVLEIERAAFLDGHYLAFGVRYCNLCKVCVVDQGEACPTPDKVRPCDQLFGIDVFQTARQAGLRIEVLRTKEQTQDRYGFVFID